MRVAPAQARDVPASRGRGDDPGRGRAEYHGVSSRVPRARASHDDEERGSEYRRDRGSLRRRGHRHRRHRQRLARPPERRPAMDAVVHPRVQRSGGAADGRRGIGGFARDVHRHLLRRRRALHGHGRTSGRHRAEPRAEPHARYSRGLLWGDGEPRGGFPRTALRRIFIRRASRKVRRGEHTIRVGAVDALLRVGADPLVPRVARHARGRDGGTGDGVPSTPRRGWRRGVRVFQDGRGGGDGRGGEAREGTSSRTSLRRRRRTGRRRESPTRARGSVEKARRAVY